MSRQRPAPGRVVPAVLALVAAVGIGLVAFGVLAGRAVPVQGPNGGPLPPEVGGEASGAKVRPGAVTVTADPPSDVKAPGEAICAGCDVVLVTVCSLRKDYVSAYGLQPGLTPAIDALAAEGVRFDRAYAASSFTLASLTAVLTGRFGSSTGVLGWDKGLVADVPTLPEVLGYYGYRTAGFTIDAASGFRPDYGLDRGFQRLEIVKPPRDTPDGRRRRGKPGAGGETAKPAAKWISEQPTDQPIFAMLHSRTAHFPFVIEKPTDDPTGVLQALWEAGGVLPPGKQAMPGDAGGTAQVGAVDLGGGDPAQELVRKVGPAAIEVWRKAYADAVARMDVDVKTLVEAVAARGRLDRTVFVVVGDHGESLWDHDEALHGDAYFDTVANVPLVVRVPGIAPRADAAPALVSQVDLMPTILELVGAVPPTGIDGRSLLPLLRGEAETVREIALVEGGVAKNDASQLRGAVISLPFTLLRQPPGCGGGADVTSPRSSDGSATCLYDLTADPGQTKNLARERPEVVEALVDAWREFRASRGAEARQLSLDPTFVETLRKSGYDFRSDAAP
ncbi:MAG: sulfatase [Myxococcota bacterium]